MRTLIADPRRPWRCGSCTFSCDCLADHQDCNRRIRTPRRHHALLLGLGDARLVAGRQQALDVDQLQQDGAQDTQRPASRSFPGE